MIYVFLNQINLPDFGEFKYKDCDSPRILNYGIKTDKLSGGQTRILSIAERLVKASGDEIDILALDEPFNDLDADNINFVVKELVEMLKMKELILLMGDH
jgi:ABC-type multidrug transport system ATPase subunit